jgi:hypothetical protein
LAVLHLLRIFSMRGPGRLIESYNIGHMAYIHYVLSHYECIRCQTKLNNSLKDKEGRYVNF